MAGPRALPELRPCATLDRLPRSPALTTVGPPSLASGKSERDPYGLPNVELTEHFRISWGNSGGVSSAEIATIAASFEDSWSLYVDEMDHPQPYGTESYYFNVFIGDSGNGAPSGYGAGGYYSGDPDGWPMIVVSANTLNDGAYSQITAAHEFYHAIQGSLATYDYQGESAWFWEATATWASAQVYPDNIYYGSFLFSYYFYPHYPVNFFDYPDTGALLEYYQYGSFLWPLYISETASDWSVIRDAWTDANSEEDPMEAMRAGLAARGVDLDEVWLDHLASNQTWDFAQGELLREWVEAYAGHYSEGENMVAAEHDAAGTDGWIDGPSALRPRRYGSNAISMEGPVEGTLTVYIQGDEEGSESSDAEFGARLILVDSDGDAQVLEVPFEGVYGELSTDQASEAAELWLVVGAWTERLISSRWEDEDFGYRYALLVDDKFDPPEDTGSPDTGGDTAEDHDSGDTDDAFTDVSSWGSEDPELIACGCAQNSRGAGGWWVLPIGLLAWLPRRRSTGSSRRPHSIDKFWLATIKAITSGAILNRGSFELELSCI